MFKNKCQYWVDDPVQCSYWDNDAGLCGYSDESTTFPTKFPKCNRIGTDDSCSHYTGEGTAFRCILPDPSRHVGQRWIEGGGKWEIDQINEYNNGECDGEGTATTCSGYSPYHMAFSTVKPDSFPFTETEGFATVPSDVVFRLPLYYDVAYLRAQLSRCYWWKDDPAVFTIDEQTGAVGEIPHKCTNMSDEKIREYWDNHSYDKELGMWKAPCNGCKPECPGYTGVCWEYCVDSKMRQGDKVLAEQILELRYYLFRENWDPDKYKSSFARPEIHAWAGKTYQNLDITNTYSVNWLIDTWHVYFSDFSYFNLSRDKTVLTAGTQANDYAGEYPDLVRSINSPPLKPIIRNKFDVINDVNIFEVNDLNHDEVLIFGDTFGYNTQTYAINLSDPDLAFLPKSELLAYPSMFDMKMAWKNIPDRFDDFYSKFSSQLELMLEYIPDKIPTSEIPKDTGMFYIGAHTFFGNNDVIVVSKINGEWEYDHIYFMKTFVGGVISQRLFSIEGEGTTDYLPSYQDDFMANTNKNGLITFDFNPLVSSKIGDVPQLAYVYNDAVKERLQVNPMAVVDGTTFVINYKLYKITFSSDLEMSVSDGGLRVLGVAGYILVILDDPSFILSNAVKDWEIDGDMYLYYEDGHRVEMVVHEKSTSRLETNQFIIRPKQPEKFKSVCTDTYLNIPNIYVYEKHSFGEVPDTELPYEEVQDDFIGEDDIVINHGVDSIVKTGNGFTLAGFNQDTLMISAVIRGATGRIKSHVKTKLITWVRQPYCRDVEIYYQWSAFYEKYTLLPQYNCYLDNGEQLGREYHLDENGVPKSIERRYVPPCGDHDLSVFSGNGAMWYPYGDCSDYERYNIVGNLSEWSIALMEIFRDDFPVRHGQFDMRMLGPADHFGETCDIHATIKNCVCDWSFCNSDKIGSNRFVGYANYRGGMGGIAKERALRSGGSLPRFGNTYRDFLRSYRAVDNIDYYYFNEFTGMFTRKYKWVPPNEYYTTVDPLVKTSSYKYKTYSSSDYYNDGSFFINPFGLYRASSTIEGVNIQETLYVDEDEVPYRYTFDEVFNTHSTTAGISYPFPRKPYFRMISGVPTAIISWYTYKDFPGGDISKSIQWAWQEVWKTIERTEIDGAIFLDPENLSDMRSLTYNNDGVGRHSFLSVAHPDYKYDFTLREHRLVTNESNHELLIIPSNYNQDSPTLFLITLDGGPFRIFDLDGNWVDNVPDDVEFEYEDYNTYKEQCKNIYDWCVGGDWVEEDLLFDSDTVLKDTQLEYNTDAEDDDRVIYTYDDEGYEVKTYYHRGLSVVLNPHEFSHLPFVSTVISPDVYELKLSEVPTESSNDYTDSESVDFYVPAANYLDLKYDCTLIDGGVVEIVFNFSGDGEDYKKRVLSRVKCVFTTGYQEDLNADNPWIGELYHEPAVEILVSNDGISFNQIYSDDAMSLSNTRSGALMDTEYLHKISFDAEFVKNPVNFVKLRFRIVPTYIEKSRANVVDKYDVCRNWVHLKYIYLYELEFVPGTETIKTHERKYNISYGSHGDVAPHGNAFTGSLLYYMPSDRSTVYQMDTSHGMMGMANSAGSMTSMNKLRGRIMKECHSDKERLIGTDIYKYENEQQKIHDDIAIDAGEPSFVLSSVTPPGLEDILNKLNMSFPSWTCSFSNSYVRPLSPIAPREMYSPYGHKFKPDLKNVYREYACGRFGTVYGRWVRDVFEYMFVNYYDDLDGTASGGGTIDAITAYVNHSVGTILVNDFLFMAPPIKRAPIAGAGGYESTQDGDVVMIFPYEVVNLY